MRHLILDDDVRVEFSKAHDHARAIAVEVLAELTELLPGLFDVVIHIELNLSICRLLLQYMSGMRKFSMNCS